MDALVVEFDVTAAVEEDDGGNTETDPECTEEEMEDHQEQVLVDEYKAVQNWYDPDTQYRCPS